MIRQILLFIIILIGVASCVPSNYLKLDVLEPAEVSFKDSGNIMILNASYLPSALKLMSDNNLNISAEGEYILDTLVINNIFNGLFSVLNESPLENLRNAEYYELRTSDTTNFLAVLPPDQIIKACNDYNCNYIVSMELYTLMVKDTPEGSRSVFSRTINYKTLWRIYNDSGEKIHEHLDIDTAIWELDVIVDYDADGNASYYSSKEIPDVPDAIREVFFDSGEKFGSFISPHWSTISRTYYPLFRNGEDVSLNKNVLQKASKSKIKNLAYKSYYNLAVISESNDNLSDALSMLEAASKIKQTEYLSYYQKKLKERAELRKTLEYQIETK